MDSFGGKLSIRERGGADGVRTHGLQSAILALSQTELPPHAGQQAA